jgi:hypothetical protein
LQGEDCRNAAHDAFQNRQSSLCDRGAVVREASPDEPQAIREAVWEKGRLQFRAPFRRESRREGITEELT